MPRFSRKVAKDAKPETVNSRHLILLFRFPKNFLNAAYLPVRQPHLYAVRVIGGIGEQVLNDAYGQSAGSLVLLQNNSDLQAGMNIFSCSMRHNIKSCCSPTTSLKT